MAKLRKLNKAQLGAVAWGVLLLFTIAVYGGADSQAMKSLTNTFRNLTSWPGRGELDSEQLANIKAEIKRLTDEQRNISIASTKQWQEARVIGRIDNSRQLLLLNKGSDDGIDNKMSVVGNGFFVGKVWRVEPHRATVLIIGDPDLVVAAVIAGSGSDGLVESRLGGVVFSHVLSTKQSLSGKKLITSGAGNIVPAGLPIGMVTSEISSSPLGENTWGIDYPDTTGLLWVRVGGN